VLNEPVVSGRLWDGLRDHCARVRRSLPRTTWARSLRTITQMLDASSFGSSDVSGTLSALRTIRPYAIEMNERLEATGKRGISRRALGQLEEARYWSAALLARIDAALSDLRVFAPFAETLLSERWAECANEDRFRDVDDALRRIPKIAETRAHFEYL